MEISCGDCLSPETSFLPNANTETARLILKLSRKKELQTILWNMMKMLLLLKIFLISRCFWEFQFLRNYAKFSKVPVEVTKSSGSQNEKFASI